MIKKLIVWSAFVLTLLFGGSAVAAPAATTSIQSNNSLCPSAGILGAGLVKKICWDCVLPVMLFSIPVGSKSVPDDHFSGLVCHCKLGSTGISTPGAPTGLRSMARVAEVVRNPHCSPLLGNGANLFGNSLLFSTNKKPKIGDGSDRQYYNTNMWNFPLLYLIEALLDKNCTGDSSLFNLVSASTFSPTWKCDECSFALNPEATIFASPYFVMLATIDGLAITASPDTYGNNSMRDRWLSVIGTWGSSLYPLTGNVPHSSSGPQGSALVTAKALALEHRLGKARLTVGGGNMCGGTIYPFLPKTQYKISQLFPFPQASDQAPNPAIAGGAIPGLPPACGGDTGTPCPAGGLPRSACCNQFGESSLRWNEWRTMPGFEDYIYLIFRWTDCCIPYF